MITAEQATSLVSQNTIDGYLRDIEKEITSAAVNGNIFTQVRVPSHVSDTIIKALEANGFCTCQSVGADVAYINISWPLPDTSGNELDQTPEQLRKRFSNLDQGA